MRRLVVSVLPMLVVFVAGVGSGVWWKERTGRDGTPPSASRPDVSLASDGDGGAVAERKAAAVAAEEAADAGQTSTAVSVEVLSDDASGSSPEISAAHAERRARRKAAREARERDRHDFLSSLNLDLLTSEQRKRHVLYLEALETHEKARREMAALRTAGADVPTALQERLSDAESVLRADCEAERRMLREAAVRAAGLDGDAVRQLMEDLSLVDRAFLLD